MKKILITYPNLLVGGSTTSLVNLLQLINPDEYEITICLKENNNEANVVFPEHVKIIYISRSFRAKLERRLKYICTRIFDGTFIKQYLLKKNISFQVTAYQIAKSYRKIDQKYDISIGYLEGWANSFTLLKTNSNKRIIWIHFDYLKANFNPNIDRKYFEKADSIVCITPAVLKNFVSLFPELEYKTCLVENVLSAALIEPKKKEYVNYSVDKNIVNFITVCRLDIFTKGLDRAVDAFSEMIKKSKNGFHWTIIGSGNDYQELIDKISMHNLSDYIQIITDVTNPIPYLKHNDVFLLASRYEGMPMAVTEALLMGIPALVTEYSSARDQIVDGITGIIVENSEEGILCGIESIIDNPAQIISLKENINVSDYDNTKTVKEQIHKLLDGNRN